MKTAQGSTTEIITISDEVRHMSAQLHLILIGVLRDEPLNKVMNVPDSHGFEAWRKLTNHYAPTTASQFRGLMRLLLNPVKPTNEGFFQFLEK